jgi:hypothetical protein
MSAVDNPTRQITKQDLRDFYDEIYPYLGGGRSSTVKTATLTAGSTSVTFTGIPTSGNNVIDFYTTTGINYIAINTATAGQVTLTYEAQLSDVLVCCEIKGV